MFSAHSLITIFDIIWAIELILQCPVKCPLTVNQRLADFNFSNVIGNLTEPIKNAP